MADLINTEKIVHTNPRVLKGCDAEIEVEEYKKEDGSSIYYSIVKFDYRKSWKHDNKEKVIKRAKDWLDKFNKL